jgi:glycosyltransferase involved in cell wall biosynthesis
METAVKRVSVVMCTYNGEKYLKEQIDSIMDQTYPIYELIIQDDCSKDNTLHILHEYAEKYPNIRVFQNEKQTGINANFFSAMYRASGDYIAISDQDDIWELNKIEQQMLYADDFLLVSCHPHFFADDASVNVHNDERGKNVRLERIIHVNMFAGHTFLFKKTLIEKVPEKSRLTDYCMYDHLLAMVAASYESLMFIPQALVQHRRCLNSATYTEPMNFNRNICNMFRILIRTFKQYVQLRPLMAVQFEWTYSFLKSLDSVSESKQNAIKIAWYQSQSSWIACLRLSFLYVKLRDKIFYAPEKNPVLSILRAFYFPIYSSDYFRYLLRDK